MFLIFWKYIKRLAQMKRKFRDDGRWDDQKLIEIYNSVNDMFDFDSVYNRRRK